MNRFFLLFVSLCVTTLGAAVKNSALQEFTNANNLFTSSVYTEIAETEPGNFLVSPFSAETVLAFAQSGAKGATAEEIRTALHLPNDKNQVESALKSLLPKFKGNDFYTLHTANKLYVKENFHIKDEFKNAASLVYDADSEEIDFVKNVEAAEAMNSWIEKHTNNKIKDLIKSDDLDEDTRAILINALYFKAKWSTPFSNYTTEKKNFHKTAAKAVEVDTMQLYEEYFKYYESRQLKAQIVELPFEGNEASMVIVLPNEKEGLSNMEKQLNHVFSPQHQLQDQFLNVALPKFKMETSIDFKTILQNLGVKKAFDESQADLSGIAGNPRDLFINKVAQKTFIDVNEEGVEAAAATFVSIKAESTPADTPKDFIADHPFIFYIKVKDIVIFAGRVTDPSNQ